MSICKGYRNRGFTLIEILVAAAILTVLFTILYRVMLLSRGAEADLSSHAAIQFEARKAFITVLEEVQEGMAIVLPEDGHTAGFLVVRDRLDRMAAYHLVKNPADSKAEGTDIFDLVRVIQDYTGSDPARSARAVVRNILRFTVTATGSGGVTMNITIQSGKKRYSLTSMVRLKCLAALEAL